MALERKYTYKYPTRKDSSKCIALEKFNNNILDITQNY